MMRAPKTQFAAIPLKAAPTGLKPHKRSFCDRAGEGRITVHERINCLGVPCNRMLYVEYRMKVEIMTIAGWDTEPFQPPRYSGCARRRGHFDNTESCLLYTSDAADEE